MPGKPGGGTLTAWEPQSSENLTFPSDCYEFVTRIVSVQESTIIFAMMKRRICLLVLCFAFLGLDARAQGQSETAGKILMFDEPMILSIYLPPNFEPNQSYPSLYLLHGQSQDVTLWTRLGVRETLDELILSERIQPIIVIMPQEENYLQDVEKSDFERRLIENLIPFVERNFPVIQARSARAIGGISRGAFWSQLIALKNYDLFGVLGQHSLLTAYYSTSSLIRIFEDSRDLPTLKIRIDIGNEDFYVEEEAVFANQLQTLKIPHTFILNEGKHDEEYWKTHLRDYLIWYAEALETE